MNKGKIKIYLLVFLVVALGFFLRIYNIEHTPPGIYSDEAINGEDAYKANDSGVYQLYYANNQGREGLFINLVALSFKLFGGISILALKFPAIFFSTLTILGIYILVKEIFTPYLPKKRVERIALISSFLSAVSFWALNFGRISFRANMVPTVFVFSFYFLFKGLRTKKWWDFVIGGIIFGIGMHTYTAWKIAPLIPLALLPIFYLTRKNFFREYWKKIIIFAFFFLIVSIPIFYIVYLHPEFIVDHATASDDISIFSPLLNHGHPFLILLRSLFLSLIKYNFVGDMNWRDNYPPYPILDVLTGIAFLFGICLSFIKLIRLLRQRFYQKIKDTELEIHAFLILTFFIMLAPEFFSAEGVPHALRSIGTLPVVFIFSALAFDYFFSNAQRKNYFLKKSIQTLLIFSLLFIGIFNPLKYFFFWSNNPKTAEAFEKNLADISQLLKTLPAEKEKFIINSFGPFHNPLDRLPIQIFNLHSPNTTYFYSWQNFDQIKPKTNDFIIILTSKDADTESRLKVVFPNLTLQPVKNSLGSVYYILK